MSDSLAQTHIAFIGGGNMARSMIGGLLARARPPAAITVADPDTDARAQVAALGDVTTVADGADALADADLCVLAVKPQVLREVVRPLAPALADRRPLVVSIAAGVRLEALACWLGSLPPLVRCMPNTPALVGAGMSALCARDDVREAERGRAEALLAAVGDTTWVEDEAQLDAVTAVSGSGPAYFFRFMEALVEAGVAAGLPRATATRLVLQSGLGAARMAAETGEDPGALRRQVTSKGGTTAAALEVLDEAGLAQFVDQAVAAAAERSRALGAALSKQA